jgi:tetratricopeptide (TPR) repeat protein
MAQFGKRTRRASRLLVHLSPFAPRFDLIHQSPTSPVQCIGEAFGVNPADKEQVDRLSVKPATLQTIFEVFLKTKDKIGSTAQVPPSASPAAPVPTSAENKAAAEKLKLEGNALMSSKQYDKAIHAYTEAAKLDPSHPVYLSNRAAAYSNMGDHLTAAVDAENAIKLDPKFVRGYSRLGCRAAGFRIGISLLTSLRTDMPATASVTTLPPPPRTVVALN